MSYIDDIKTFHPLTLEDICRTAIRQVPLPYQSVPWTCPGLEHGTACLETEEQLDCYLAAYGEMHKGKLECGFANFPFELIDDDFEVIDWGCGQGLASVCLLDNLRKKGAVDRLQKITLIEPSGAALARARLNLECIVGDDVYVEALNYYLPTTNTDEEESNRILNGIRVEEPICIHLFSNILDIADLDLKELALMIGSSGYRHYFVCVGPMNFGNDRIFSFLRYFRIKKKDIYTYVKCGQYRQLANGKWYSCVAVTFQLVREEGKPFLVPLTYYPPKQFFGAYRLDVIEDKDMAGQKALESEACISAFEVLAPFDIGASIYEDIDPVLAVLSNMITRGLPTKCSPFVEREVGRAFRCSKEEITYGSIHFGATDDKRVEANEDLLRKIPVGIARIQKMIIEAILTGHLSMQEEKWEVLVKENDIPCAALAFADLRMMYEHLTAMSTDYADRVFPQVSLYILSKHHSASPLHLDATTYRYAKRVDREKVYDMVIDFSIDETIDAANVQFSEFKAKNNCYFNVRSSKKVYSTRDIYTTDRIQYHPVTRLNANGEHDVIEEMERHLAYFLQLLFRKQNFRPGQLPILNRALQNKGVIGLLPTGGGKSLTYQLSAMLQPGITVVIDPLKSLMADQYDGLISTGIDCCTYINSELSTQDRAAHELLMESSQVVFAFMSPERLCIYEFRERLQNMYDLHVYFSYGVIDEVHCVSEWGQDFRFSYLHLGRNLYNYVRAKNGPIALFGLTATASFDVLSDVERELTGNGAFRLDPDAIIRYENSNRLELQYKIEKIEVNYQEDGFYDLKKELEGYPKAVNIGDQWGAYRQKSEFLLDYLKRIPGYLRELQTKESLKRIVDRFKERENLTDADVDELLVDMPDDYYKTQDKYDFSGIVFCPHVNSTGISVSYNAEKLQPLCEIGTFSGSSQEGAVQGNDSMKNMRRFRENRVPIMVATKAFGMGIDKPNVRFTINLNYSSSLESFVQEAGRAGRDRKMALSVIFLSDYHLARINKRCPDKNFPLSVIKSKWFKVEDLRYILADFKLNIDEQYIDYCDPLTDIVRLKCSNTEKDRYGNVKTWRCNSDCSKSEMCTLRLVNRNMRGWQYHKDLDEYLRLHDIRIPKEGIEYQGTDYHTVMFFFDTNFKGEYEEKMKMNYLLSQKEMDYFIGNDKKEKPSECIRTEGFMEVVLNSPLDTEVVCIISYEEESYADIAKAIYRMCVIGLIDDFTQDYGKQTFRILVKKKKEGTYYERLKEFLMRYYSEERAEAEVEKARMKKGDNEIHKCLGYLTEFIYDKVAQKRKRAIDDMRNFCLVGVDDSKDWKVINEDLKDEIYYYFNSKFAREGYKTDNGEDFSLLDDTQRGKISTFEIVYKYMRVVDNDVIGMSGSPKDNIKHLHGAVRLIRRSETNVNGALCLLNAFCLLALKMGNNKNMMDEIDRSFIEGYQTFKQEMEDRGRFYDGMNEFRRLLNAEGRNLVSAEDLKHLENLEMQVELLDHQQWIENFVTMYSAL